MKKYGEKESEKQQTNEPDYSGSYTVKDYLKWSFDGLFEIIKGKVWKMSPAPTSSHQRINFNLSFEFGKVFKGQKCEAFHAPFDVYLNRENEDISKGTTVVQSDVCVICNPNKIQERGCIGAPDLVVEIISPSTARKDMYDKFNVYEEFGVKEYWIVFPGQNAINIFSLVEGKFELRKTFEEEEILQSPLFEQLRFKVAEVF